MKFKLPEIPPPKLISTLRGFNLLPAIIFMPTRRRCDEAATEVALDKSQKTDAPQDFDKRRHRRASRRTHSGVETTCRTDDVARIIERDFCDFDRRGGR